MDLAVFLEATQPLEVKFAGDVIKLEIYTAGVNRLTKEQRAPVLELSKNEEEADFVRNYCTAVESSRLALPLMIKSWDLLWQGAPLPVAEVNVKDGDQYRYTLPDDFIFAIRNAVRKAVAEGPTGAENSLSTSEPTANAIPSPVASE